MSLKFRGFRAEGSRLSGGEVFVALQASRMVLSRENPKAPKTPGPLGSFVDLFCGL